MKTHGNTITIDRLESHCATADERQVGGRDAHSERREERGDRREERGDCTFPKKTGAAA